MARRARDRSSLGLSHRHDGLVHFRVEADFTGTGEWSPALVNPLAVKPGQQLEYAFSDSFSAYWVRLVADQDTVATATFTYD